ncbi:acyltransferase family protein [Galactobacter valiniphilus]|uniref:acyltransferase family protein n=1 Tax=Galactobacter valiniphilus TaxID=2676122 RepID=UPI003735F759
MPSARDIVIDPAGPAPRRFLPEVQALRALAVGLVVLYHLYPAAAPGGFVGVDVFFVISGFLITGHLLREVEANGRVSLPRFWAARVRRIMPAALVTIAAVVLAAPLIWPVTQWADISKQALASVLSVQNWVLAFDSVDYLSKDNQPTALQHFWSLGVEEQFYVFWPFVVMAAAVLAGWAMRRAARASGRRRAPAPPRVRAWAVLLFCAVLLASLAYSFSLVLGSDPSAYFVTTTRVWELAAGGLLAALLPAAGWAAPGWVRRLVALAGVAVLAFVALRYTAQTPFPGPGAVLPVVGTLAIIAAGRTSGWGSLHPLTDWAPVQWVGNVSYSLYLWHWPVVVAFTQLALRTPRWWEAVLLGLLGLALAAASYYLVERPARNWRFTARHTWRALGIGAAATALVAAVAVVPSVRAEAAGREQAAAAAELAKHPPRGFGAQAWDVAEGGPFVKGTAVVPIPARAGYDRRTDPGCFGDAKADSTPRCEFGDKQGKHTIALVGDSHAEQWLDVLNTLALERGTKLVSYVKKSCPFSPVPRKLERDGYSVCTKPNEATMRALEKDPPDTVIVSSWTGSSFVSDSRPGYGDYLERLKRAGSRVVVLRDTPWPALRGNAKARDCVAANPTRPEACSTPKQKALHADGLAQAAAAMDGVSVVDLTDRFCSDTSCPAVIGNVLVYRDANHVGDTYLGTLAADLEARLPRGTLGPAKG